MLFENECLATCSRELFNLKRATQTVGKGKGAGHQHQRCWLGAEQLGSLADCLTVLHGILAKCIIMYPVTLPLAPECHSKFKNINHSLIESTFHRGGSAAGRVWMGRRGRSWVCCIGGRLHKPPYPSLIILYLMSAGFEWVRG